VQFDDVFGRRTAASRTLSVMDRQQLAEHQHGLRMKEITARQSGDSAELERVRNEQREMGLWLQANNIVLGSLERAADRAGRAVPRGTEAILAPPGTVERAESTAAAAGRRVDSARQEIGAVVPQLAPRDPAGGGDTSRGRGAARTGKPTVAERDSVLKAQGKPAAERRRILRAEGYNVR
jgi:hypothetical protein